MHVKSTDAMAEGAALVTLRMTNYFLLPEQGSLNRLHVIKTTEQPCDL